MKNNERPTGIVRTLPWYGAEDTCHTDTEKGKAFRRMMRGFQRVERGNDGDHVLVALPQKPVREVLHCYVLIGNLIRVRANISHYVSGNEIGEVECWDNSTRQAAWWLVLTAPITWPPEEIRMRGFQGFRYVTEPLW